jgi:hypothetical protein
VTRWGHDGGGGKEQEGERKTKKRGGRTIYLNGDTKRRGNKTTKEITSYLTLLLEDKHQDNHEFKDIM